MEEERTRFFHECAARDGGFRSKQGRIWLLMFSLETHLADFTENSKAGLGYVKNPNPPVVFSA